MNDLRDAARAAKPTGLDEAYLRDFFTYADKPVPDDETITALTGWLNNWYEQGVEYGKRLAKADGWRGTQITPQLLSDWHEDHGNVLWWTWDNGDWAEEPAWIGKPLDSDWPGHHTHWTMHLAFPAPPREGE